LFTGIVEEVGRIKTYQNGRLIIGAEKVIEDVRIGDSISVNGVCLTVTEFSTREFFADVMPETLKRTALENLPPGSAVNLERALRPCDRLGGHIVSGHIDGVGKILAWQTEKNAALLKVGASSAITRYTVEKGSVALDGISLTVVEAATDYFTVSLIPHTRQSTNLSEKKLGDPLNIETDIIGKYVEKLLQPKENKTPSRLTAEFLTLNGFC